MNWIIFFSQILILSQLPNEHKVESKKIPKVLMSMALELRSSSRIGFNENYLVPFVVGKTSRNSSSSNLISIASQKLTWQVVYSPPASLSDTLYGKGRRLGRRKEFSLDNGGLIEIFLNKYIEVSWHLFQYMTLILFHNFDLFKAKFLIQILKMRLPWLMRLVIGIVLASLKMIYEKPCIQLFH